MVNKKTLSINFPIQRVVLSDVLPYEVPILFSNRYFYRFLCENNINISGEKISWNRKDEVLDNLVKMLFGVKVSKSVIHKTIDGIKVSSVDCDKSHTIPFVFSTTHKKDRLRQLSLIHTLGQLQVISFYEKYMDLMIYYAGRSDFSLRKPTRVAGCSFIDYKSQIERTDGDDNLVEIKGEDYENLKSFFVYERFSNVFKFYESREHLRCERDFEFLTKLDISSCFDSIYTHSIAWAIYGKDFSKKNLEPVRNSFSGRFDSLMQKINYNETNGIPIGPEISRIFAEIILQKVDLSVEEILLEKGLSNNKDYKIYRYVDDYFIFYNEGDVFSQIKMSLQESLKLFKLSLNNGKEECFNRPIITPISIAKKRISDLFDSNLSYKFSEYIREGETLPRGEIYIKKTTLITDFKSILSISGIGYGEILNYSLSIVERKVGQLFVDYKKIENVDGTDKSFSKSIEALLDFVFFVYGVSPKVNTTIKLCRICQRVISFYKKEKIGLSYGDLISQIIYQRSRAILDAQADGKIARIETMYLLVMIQQLGKNYRIDESTLAYMFGFEFIGSGYESKKPLDYFSIITLLFYIGKKVRYSSLKLGLEKNIIEKFTSKNNSLIGDSELIHLALDIIVCPFVSNSTKKQILSLFNIPTNSLNRLYGYSKYWFTKWENFDFSKELDAKVSQQVY